MSSLRTLDCVVEVPSDETYPTFVSDPKEMMPSAHTLQFAQLAVTTLGFFTVILQLSLEYRWRRRQYALNMMAEWNKHTADHRAAIDLAYPGLLDTTGPAATVHLSKEQARDLYRSSESSDRELNVVERHIIELLNYCEFVAVSSHRAVADQKILAESFQKTLHVWHHELAPYIQVTTRWRGYNPWQPFTAFVLATRCQGCHLNESENGNK